MVSKPKACKYGCGTIISWNEVNRFFMGPDGQKHDCRDWDKASFPVGGGNNVGTNSAGGNMTGAYVVSSAPPTNGETLIALQAKKTWENYFKLLEPICANLVSIVQASEESNKHLIAICNQIKELEDTITVQRIRSGGGSTSSKKAQEVVEEGQKENGA